MGCVPTRAIGARHALLRCLLFAAVAVVGLPDGRQRPALAQPAASFQAKCQDLRSELAKLDFRGDPLIVIQVEGKLIEMREGSPVMLAMCVTPGPRVVCVSYSLDGLAVGADVVFSGSIARRSPSVILLDPCLHYRPD